MGQKVHPYGMRLGIIRPWISQWYASKKNYKNYLKQDIFIRDFLYEKLHHISISKIEIERLVDKIRVIIHTARPGLVIGKKGEEIEALKKKMSQSINLDINLSIEPIRRPEIDAQTVSDSICRQLEKRIMYKRAIKRAISSAMRSGALGIKISAAGRLNGAEIARSEIYKEGRVPLHTLRADIDYGYDKSLTQYGLVGIKVWIFKDEIYDNK